MGGVFVDYLFNNAGVFHLLGCVAKVLASSRVTFKTSLNVL